MKGYKNEVRLQMAIMTNPTAMEKAKTSHCLLLSGIPFFPSPKAEPLDDADRPDLAGRLAAVLRPPFCREPVFADFPYTFFPAPLPEADIPHVSPYRAIIL